jgi:hypothetical protein
MSEDDQDKPKSVLVELTGVGGVGIAGDVKLRYHTPLPADHPFYRMVGRVASEWSHLEHMLDLIIWHLASWRAAGLGSNVVACITSQIMGVGPRCKVIITLGRIYLLDDKKVLQPFRTLMGQSYTLADKRARVVHDPWYLDVASKEPSQFRAMPYSDPHYGQKDITEQEVEALIGEIRALQTTAGHLRNVVLDALEASARKLV